MKRALLLAIAACHADPPKLAPTADAAPPVAVAPAPAIVDAATAAPAPPPELARICSFYACTAGPDRVTLADGTSIAWDDGRTKKTQERIDAPDVEDVFALGYPKNGAPIAPVTDPEQDPGRVRIESLFRATYGADARAVSAALVPVTIAGHTVSFHRLAAPALERVAARIAALLKGERSSAPASPAPASPPLAPYFKDLGGTFNPRNIAGTAHASAHSWGIAIDIDTSMSDYWRNGVQPSTWRNRIPQSIVDAFEAEGFVWGGRWFHYDTMHFEYRPELFGPRTGLADSH